MLGLGKLWWWLSKPHVCGCARVWDGPAGFWILGSYTPIDTQNVSACLRVSRLPTYQPRPRQQPQPPFITFVSVSVPSPLFVRFIIIIIMVAIMVKNSLVFFPIGYKLFVLHIPPKLRPLPEKWNGDLCVLK